MTQHRVIAEDSLSAMDQISKVLGKDAVILETNKVNGKIEILGSAHNFKEIYFKKKQGVSKLFLSPLFKVKKSKNNIGIIKYRIFSKLISAKTIALGGINRANIKKLKMLNCEGFASISYFKNG